MKKILIGALVVFVMLGILYKYLYREHRDISKETPVFSIASNQLLNDFTLDESEANVKYLDKSILIEGKVTSFDNTNKTIVIDEKILVILKENKPVKKNKVVKIQGRVIGFDSLIGEIKIDQAEIK
jgi:hypothetical protein